TILTAVSETAQDREENEMKRRAAIELLSFDEFSKAKPILEKLLDAHESQEIQIAAVRSINGFKDVEVASLLIAPWRSFTPAVREEVFAALFARRERLKPLLDAVASGQISASQINPARKTMLSSHCFPPVREQAAKVFGGETVGSRKEVLEKY